MAEPFTIPEMDLTLEPDGRVRITMADDSDAFILRSRLTTRNILRELALGTPGWLTDE